LAFFHGGGKKGKISKMSELVRKDEAWLEFISRSTDLVHHNGYRITFQFNFELSNHLKEVK
jgi:hypothetical protein